MWGGRWPGCSAPSCELSAALNKRTPGRLPRVRVTCRAGLRDPGKQSRPRIHVSPWGEVPGAVWETEGSGKEAFICSRWTNVFTFLLGLELF